MISWAEKGILPDSLIRLGIRRFQQRRLAWAKQKTPEEVEKHHQKWVETLKKSPIALVPEKANEQHYEVPASFFELILGKNLKYSSGYWPNGVHSLDGSEKAMLDLYCQRAQLRDGQDILDLGCGWGSLTLHLSKKYPGASITAVSNSQDQHQYIKKKCKENGLDNVQMITADMNAFSIERKFDRVVSIEMFEHMRNYKALLCRIAAWLREEGKLFIHIFSHSNLVYPFEDTGSADWMGRMFFSGGLMPSHQLLLYFQDDLSINKTWRLGGEHYQHTSAAWLTKLELNKKYVLELFKNSYGNEESYIWLQRWRIFFMACEELFGFNEGTEWGVSHYLFQKNT